MSTLYVDNIYSKTGTSQALTIDSAGRVTTPARPAFLVHRGGSAATLTEGNDHQIFPFNAVAFDIGGNYNTTNFNYVCPVDGVYFFALNARIDGAAAGNYIRGLIYKGSDAATQTAPYGQVGNVLHAITGSHSASHHTMVCSGVLLCSSGDIVTAMGGHQTDTSITLQAESQFSGFLIG